MECSIVADWEIDEKTLKETPRYYSTPEIEITIPHVTYSICLDNDEEPDKIELLLYLENFTPPIHANLIFSIPSANFSKNLVHNFCNGYGSSIHVFSRQSLLNLENGYIQNGKLTIQVRGTFKCETYAKIEHVTVGQLCWGEDDKDFTIQVGNEEIKVHKLILRVRSSVFAAMFNSGMKEALENKVKIDGFPFHVVKLAIRYCYDKDAEYYYERLTIDDRLFLLQFSDIYDIEELKENVEIRTQKKLSPENVCRVAKVAMEYNAKNLRLCCMNFLIQCSKNFVAVNDFDSLDADFKIEFASKIVCLKI